MSGASTLVFRCMFPLRVYRVRVVVQPIDACSLKWAVASENARGFPWLKKKARQTLEGFPPLASVARLGPEFPLNLATLDAGGRAAVQPGLPDRAGYLTQSGNTVPCST